VLLARELRLVDGIWVYTQAELMSFFRGGATDLREETPIYVVGFTPSPARDVLQAAAIYAGRLTWIDHREWPPEDLGALKESLGEEQVWIAPGLGSCLPLMIEAFTRRSRFSDKLVDLAAGRFTEHDYERWGRVWWARLAEIASQSGSAMSALEPLLAGRPSDLRRRQKSSSFRIRTFDSFTSQGIAWLCSTFLSNSTSTFLRELPGSDTWRHCPWPYRQRAR
jgi:hypothetical protein